MVYIILYLLSYVFNNQFIIYIYIYIYIYLKGKISRFIHISLIINKLIIKYLIDMMEN